MKRPTTRGGLSSPPGRTIQRLRMLLPALLLAALTGCATAKVPQFDAFANAGTAYTQAVTGLITEVGDSAINANSVKLIGDQRLLTPDPLPIPSIRQQDQEMRDYLAQLNRLQAQTTLLGNYFQALADLATSSAPQSFATEVTNVANTLGGVTQEVRGTAIAKQAQIANVAGSVGGLIVKGVQGRELQKELEARKDTISQVLQLQQAMLQTLGRQAQANAQFTNALDYDQKVIVPLTTGQVTPQTQQAWMAERLALLSQPVLVDQVNTAAKAALSLQQAWNKLLTNDLSLADIQAITSELAPVLTSLDALKQPPAGGNPQ